MNFPLSNQFYWLWRNANWHWLILTHPHEDFFLPPLFNVIHHWDYFVGSLGIKKHHNILWKEITKLQSNPLAYILLVVPHLKSITFKLHPSITLRKWTLPQLLRSEWLSSPTKILYVEYRKMVEQKVPHRYPLSASIIWQRIHRQKWLCGSFGIQVGDCETQWSPRLRRAFWHGRPMPTWQVCQLWSQIQTWK